MPRFGAIQLTIVTLAQPCVVLESPSSNMIDFFICRVFGWTYMVFFFSCYSVTLTGVAGLFFRIIEVFTKAGKERDLAMQPT